MWGVLVEQQLQAEFGLFGILDHGRRADGGHGGDSPMEMTTFILVSGPGAAIGTPSQDTFIVDVAVTALTHLGIEIDPAWGLDGNVVGLR